MTGVATQVILIVGVVGDVETLITTNIATPNASAAAELYQNLFSSGKVNWTLVMESTLIALQVTGCVPGYFLDELQSCQLCPPNRYCIGGSVGAQPCPSSMYSMSGANSSTSCTLRVVVIVVLTLPIPLNNFSDIAKSKLQSAIATAVHIQINRVTLVSVASVEFRRSKDAIIEVIFDLIADTVEEATSLVNVLNPVILNQNLASHGLPKATIQSITITAAAYPQSTQSFLSILIGSIATAITVILVFGFLLFRHSPETEEDRQFRMASQSLRSRLHINISDGFLLNTEAALTCAPLILRMCRISSKDGHNIVQRSYLEAAVRLSMLQVSLSIDHECKYGPISFKINNFALTEI